MNDQTPEPKRRGRKPGSKNKVKGELNITDAAVVTITEHLVNLAKRNITELTRADIRLIAKHTGRGEAKGLVAMYYRYQDLRIKLGNRLAANARECAKIDAEIADGKPAREKPADSILSQIMYNEYLLAEDVLKKALGDYADNDPLGHALMQIHGIGPVISAGLLAYLDVTKSKTAGGFWRFCGLDPTSNKAVKGEKRAYCAAMKRLMYIIGTSFIKFHKSEQCFYGHLYAKKYQELVVRNENGEYAEDAAKYLKEKNWDTKTKSYTAYMEGKLPNHQLVARARIHAVTIFISHLFDAMWRREYGEDHPAPVPYVKAHLNHVHIIESYIPYVVYPDHEANLDDVEKISNALNGHADEAKETMDNIVPDFGDMTADD